MTAALSCHARPVPRFDGGTAYDFLRKQCEFGSRVPGSAAHQQCRDYLMAALRATADQVTQQPFLHTFGRPPRSVQAYNLIANFAPQNRDRILLCAHWDSRPWADQDPDPKNRNQPVPGANDGASGVAVLLTLAQILKAEKPPIGVDIVLLDAEDQGMEGDNRSYAKGSAMFAKQLVPSYRPRYGILLDMIGDSDLKIYQESYSLQYARPVVEKVWQTAEALGLDSFIAQEGYAVFDDHLPLLERGITCIDLIDFDYPSWHTVADTPDKCSPESLTQVGRVLVQLIYAP